MTNTITNYGSSPAANAGSSPAGWNNYGKIFFRIFSVYFLLQALPLDRKFYSALFAVDWVHLHYGTIFNLTHYSPTWTPGPQGFADWGVLFGIALVIAAAWAYLENRRQWRPDYNKLYYWVRVVVRYRLAVGMIGYGFLKLFPLQAPFPSLSNLNTNYGDFTRWKLFSLSLGVVPSYESFLGSVEILSALLLLYRRSASVGAFIILVFLGNVFMSNLAYGGGDQVYSLYLIGLALFILSYDAGRLADLLVFQRPAAPNSFKPNVAAKWQRVARLALKTVFIFFFVFVYGFKTHTGYKSDPYQFPVSRGLDGAAGIYNVTEFRIGKDTLAYSRTDSLRWQDVVFEKWATLSVRSNRPVVLDSNNIERPDLSDAERTYELEGSAGRHYYRYAADTTQRLLTLQNKNPHYSEEKFVLHYDRPSGTRIVLWGVDANKDSLYVVLDRVEKKYLLEEARKKGRQGGLKL